MAELQFQVGDKVFVSGKIYQSANGTLTFGDSPKITSTIKKVAPKGAHPYAVEDIYGWFDINSVKPALDLEVGDTVSIIKPVSYYGQKLALRYKEYEITALVDDKVTVSYHNLQTVVVNAYNLEKLK